jgi:hypothetical protein
MVRDPGARQIAVNPPKARSAIERAVWEYGITGESCALLTERIIRSLTEASFLIAVAHSD